MKISIVTPSFNQGAFIADAIESVLVQKYLDFEHIVIDSCSTDKTPEILAKYPHLKVIREPDKGQSDALNKGFRVATGHIIGRLNAADKYLPGCFEKIVQAFHKYSEADIIYGDDLLVDLHGRLIRLRKEPPFDMFLLKYLDALYIPTTTAFLSRRIFEQSNFLNVGYHEAMDYDFFLRLASRGYRFRHIPHFLADFRWHEEARSQEEIRREREEMDQALLAQDPFLVGMGETPRHFFRNIFRVAARLKRGFLKTVMGFYVR